MTPPLTSPLIERTSSLARSTNAGASPRGGLSRSPYGRIGTQLFDLLRIERLRNKGSPGFNGPGVAACKVHL